MIRETVIVRSHADLLRAHCLDTLVGAASSDIGRIIQAEGHEVVKVESGSTTLYVKRMGPVLKWRHVLRSLFRHGRVRSRAHQEWHNYLHLMRVGVLTATPVALGEACGLTGDRFSFIVTEAAPGDPLDEVVVSLRDDEHARRQLAKDLGRWIKRFHDRGLAFPDLYARHVFVRNTADGYEFCLIDVVRIKRRRWISRRLRARDLAALNASLPLCKLAAADRVRLLRSYEGRGPSRLLPRIRRRTDQLCQRSQFKDFAAFTLVPAAEDNSCAASAPFARIEQVLIKPSRTEAYVNSR